MMRIVIDSEHLSFSSSNFVKIQLNLVITELHMTEIRLKQKLLLSSFKNFFLLFAIIKICL